MAFGLYGPNCVPSFSFGHTPVHVTPAARYPMAYTALAALHYPALAEPTALVAFDLFGPGCPAPFSFSRTPGPCDPRPQ